MNSTLRFACVLLSGGLLLIWKAETLELECPTYSDNDDFSQPICPDEYSSLIGQGFSTNWFKEEDPMRKYNRQNIIDVYNAGFRNLRLRCRAGLYPYPHNTPNFTTFLDLLELVVDDCLDVGVTPIISWINHHAEANATEEDRESYIIWWTKVAEKLRDKDYRLGFNLFTELGKDTCSKYGTCKESLRGNQKKYNIWTSQVVKAIRDTGMKNKERILILTSQKKTAKGVNKLKEDIYDPYMMMEWHTYASGPNQVEGGDKYWEGNGTDTQRAFLLSQINTALTDSHLKTYFGAWMPQDNGYGHLGQTEVENFARFFVSTLKQYNIPWSMNVLDVYYNTKGSKWITGIQNIKNVLLDMSSVLEVIKDTMA